MGVLGEWKWGNCRSVRRLVIQSPFHSISCSVLGHDPRGLSLPRQIRSQCTSFVQEQKTDDRSWTLLPAVFPFVQIPAGFQQPAVFQNYNYWTVSG